MNNTLSLIGKIAAFEKIQFLHDFSVNLIQLEQRLNSNETRHYEALEYDFLVARDLKNPNEYVVDILFTKPIDLSEEVILIFLQDYWKTQIMNIYQVTDKDNLTNAQQQRIDFYKNTC